MILTWSLTQIRLPNLLFGHGTTACPLNPWLPLALQSLFKAKSSKGCPTGTERILWRMGASKDGKRLHCACWGLGVEDGCDKCTVIVSWKKSFSLCFKFVTSISPSNTSDSSIPPVFDLQRFFHVCFRNCLTLLPVSCWWYSTPFQIVLLEPVPSLLWK